MSQDRRISDRRTVLRGGLATGTLLLAGCLGGGGSDGFENAAEPTSTTGVPETGTATAESTPEVSTVEETTASDPQPSDRGIDDDFEDGDYTSDPQWNAPTGEQGAGSIDVARRQTPAGGQHVLRLRSEGPPTAIGLTEGPQGWDGPWVADGLVYTGQLSGRGEDRILVGAATTGTSVMPGFSLGMQGTVAVNVEGEMTSASAPRLEADRWYRWELRHDGAGTVTATRWPTSGRAANGSSVSVDGLSLGPNGAISLQLIGRHGSDAATVVDHAYVRWRPGE